MIDKKSERLERFSESCTKCEGFGEITRYFGGGKYESTIECDRCRGHGVIGNCTRCGGTGTTQGVGGAPSSGIECPDCHGAGTIGDCTHCGGTGVIQARGGDSDQAPPHDVDCPKCNGFGFSWIP